MIMSKEGFKEEFGDLERAQYEAIKEASHRATAGIPSLVEEKLEEAQNYASEREEELSEEVMEGIMHATYRSEVNEYLAQAKSYASSYPGKTAQFLEKSREKSLENGVTIEETKFKEIAIEAYRRARGQRNPDSEVIEYLEQAIVSAPPSDTEV